jgi:hypothetical protein
MVLIPLILNYGINTNAMEIARFALFAQPAAGFAQQQQQQQPLHSSSSLYTASAGFAQQQQA